jgi:Arc/MetJ family transcription regulator
MGKRSVRAPRYKRKSFFVDEEMVQSARRALGVGTSAQAVRLAIERVVEMEQFWRFMTASRRSLRRRSIEAP